MGHKVHPIGFRVGIISPWQSRWFSSKNYRIYLAEDYQIREFVFKILGRPAAIDQISIERSPTTITITIHTARPGLIIGRGGTGIEELKKRIEQKFLGKNQVKGLRIEVQEVRNPSVHARLVALGVAEQLERRLPFRSVIKRTLEKIMAHREAKGAKIMVKGRLDGKEMGRVEWVAKGRMPLHTLRANIDYAEERANTTWGAIGIKVWIYKGEVFE